MGKSGGKHSAYRHFFTFLLLLAGVLVFAGLAYALPFTGGGPKSFEDYYPVDYSAHITMGSPNNSSVLLTQKSFTDGQPVYFSNIGGKTAKRLSGSNANEQYMYLDIDDSFALRSKTWIEHPRVEIDFWFYDDGTPGDTFFIQYDSLGSGAYKNATVVTKSGTNKWKNVSVSLVDHNFNNSQNGGSDFRIGVTAAGKHVYIHQVVVQIPPQTYTASSILGNPNTEDKVYMNTFTDGTAPVSSGLSQSARYVSKDSASTQYMYFDLRNSFKWNAAAKRDLRVTVEYYDNAAGNLFAVQYSSTAGGAYKETATVQGTGSNQWKLYTIPISDASFTNAQNAASDFRLVAKKATGNVNIHRVNVYITPGEYVKPYITDFTGPTFQSATDRIVYTSFFYWYDVYSHAHMNESGKDILQNHPPDAVMATYSKYDPQFWKNELQDMIDTGVDIAGLCYWGSESEMGKWSIVGLPAMVTALDNLTAEGKTPPRIGLFFDTNSLRSDYPGYSNRGHEDNGVQKGLTTQYELEDLYKKVKDFYSMIPPQYWARVDGKVWFSTYEQGNQSPIDYDNVFSYINTRFQADFGLELFLAPETMWGYNSNMEYDVHDYWGSANNVLGFGGLDSAVGGVGSGANNTATSVNSGGHPIIIPDPNGERLTSQLKGALYSGRKIIDLSNWNEMHEGGNLNRTKEAGTRNLDIIKGLLTNLQTYVYDIQGSPYRDAIGGQVFTRSTDGTYFWWDLNRTLPAGTYKVFVRAHGYNRNVTVNQVNEDTGTTVKSMNVKINSNDLTYYTLQDYYVGKIDYDGTYDLRLADWSNGSIIMDEVYLVPSYEGFKYYDLGGTADTAAVGGGAATRTSAGSYLWWELNKDLNPNKFRVYVRAKGTGTFNLLQGNKDAGTTIKSMAVPVNSTGYKEYFAGFISYDGTYNLRLADWSPAGLHVDEVHLEPHFTNFPLSPNTVWGNYTDDPADPKTIFGHAKPADVSGNYMWGPYQRRFLPNIYNFYARTTGSGIGHSFGVSNMETSQNMYLNSYTTDTNNAYADYYAGTFSYNNSYNLLLSDFGAAGGYMDFYAAVPKKDEILTYLDVGNTNDANPGIVGGKVMTLASDGIYSWWALGTRLPAGNYGVYVTVKGTGNFTEHQFNEDTNTVIATGTAAVNSPTDYIDQYVMDIAYDGTYNLRLTDWSNAGLRVDMVYLIRR
ncbi:hypothetical protein [Cohnella silvisoli]|uniref:CBM6 domain-containing protein n=1 Tax=Cohnella silvisoli TaxID=2873699 RepID=A0ABV1KMP3_9BACL|nr:hypothetical protein [Cohnella silvisoli]MCD9020373.1 hypothetical protein [Cohnella silvisoli]